MKERIAKMFPGWDGWTSFWSTLEFGREDWGWWFLAFVGLLLAATWLYRRDARDLPAFWRVWLWTLRVLALFVLLIVALEPQERTSVAVTESSEVRLLIDTSVSMSQRDSHEGDAASRIPSRADAVVALLEQTDLLARLREIHEVSIATFDSQVTPQRLLAKFPKKPAAAAPPSAPAGPLPLSSDDQKKIDWAGMLRPRGVETRLGEALAQVVREGAGETTLSGVVLITDGGNNAGVDPLAASDAAVAGKVRLITVGVGSTRRPRALQLAEIQAPTHVHIGDGFTLTAFITGQGLAGEPLEIELLSKLESDEGEPSLVETREEKLLDDGVPLAVAFDHVPNEAGRRIFRVRARPARRSAETAEIVVQDEVAIEIVDRKTRVLLVAGGPMRDYQFVRNLLNRDKTVSLDVLLQSAGPGASQESDRLLSEFPSGREELFDYDVIAAFDADWRKVAAHDAQALALLAEWVYSQAGGLILVAGDVNTPQLASASDAVREELSKLLELCPVILEAPRLFDEDDFQQPWPLAFTREGVEAGFLQLTDDAAGSAVAWREFPGIYRCFPTDGAKSGATVYARFSDPRTVGDDQPILLASQFYGAGRVLYLGSGEMWRLRAVDDTYYDRLWIRMLREVGQGRLLRGTNRGILLIERTQYPLGATVQVRVRLLDPQFRDYVADKAPLEIFDPSGRAVTPAPVLLADPTRPGHFAGSFVALAPGTYKLQLPIPESNDELKASISVRLPNIEFDHPEQNEPLLRALARAETGGVYLKLDEAAMRLPELLPDRSTERIEYNRPRELWDRPWVLYLLVGLLSAEWLTRKLLKLA